MAFVIALLPIFILFRRPVSVWHYSQRMKRSLPSRGQCLASQRCRQNSTGLVGIGVKS